VADLRYGYDQNTGHLFSYEGVFRYLGKTQSPPASAIHVGDEGMAAQLTGSYLLSGFQGKTFNTWSDGEEAYSVISWWDDGEIKHVKVDPGIITHLIPQCICGPICRDPDKIAQLCHAYPAVTMFACPVVDELAALGAVGRHVRPHRAFIAEPWDDDIEGCENQEFVDKLEGDGLGRMADISHRRMVWNQMQKTVGISPFYGMLLGEGEPYVPYVYLIQSASIDAYFPTEPISLKSYAATSVPVTVTVTPVFAKATDCKLERVQVVTVSDHIRGLPEFMRYFQLFTGKDWIGATEVCHYYDAAGRKNRPVWRYNKAYMVPAEKYVEMAYEFRGILQTK